jgi:hypothetical protein
MRVKKPADQEQQLNIGSNNTLFEDSLSHFNDLRTPYLFTSPMNQMSCLSS